MRQRETGTQLAGKTFDRFQDNDQLAGRFASPVYSNDDVGDLIFTYDSRALKGSFRKDLRYVKFKFKDSFSSNITFEYGEAVPWFNVPGYADQVKSNVNFSNLKEGIDYEILEILKFDGTNWIKVK